MAKYSKKSLLSLIAFLLLILASFRLANLAISATLNEKSPVIKHLLGESLGLEVSFRDIGFSFFSGIQVNDFLIEKDKQRLAFVRKLKAYPDLLQLFKKRLIFRKIIANDCLASTEIVGYKDLFLLRIASAAKGRQEKNPASSILRLSNFSFSLRNLKLFFGNIAAKNGFLLINSDAVSRSENLDLKTTIDFSGCNFNRSFLRKELFYNFSRRLSLRLQLAFMRDDLLVNNFALLSDNFKINGAGIVYDFKSQPVMDIKLITAPLNLKELVRLKSKIAVNGLLNIAASIKGKVSDLRFQTDMLMSKGEFYLPKNPVKVSNVFCSINLKNNELVIKELSGLINYSYPVFISGKIVNFSKPEFIFSLESNKSYTGKALAEESRNIVAKIKSRLEANSLVGEAAVSVSSTKKMLHYRSTREWGFKFDGLRLTLDKEAEPEGRKYNSFDLVSQKLFFKNQESFNGEVKSVQNLGFDNFRGKFLLYPEGGIKSQISFSGFSGAFQGRGEWDLKGKESSNYFVVRFSDLSIESLKSLYPVTADVAGILNGWVYFKNDNPAFFDGAAIIKEARISQFNLLNNIGDFLSLPSIKELKDIFIFTAFRQDKEGTIVKKLNLHNNDLNLDAWLNINNQKWVDGRVSLTLSRSILRESFIFRALLSMAKEGSEKIDFDFKVSGFPQSLRLELLEGEFRSRLMKNVSGGIRSQIENEVNKAITYFREKEKR